MLSFQWFLDFISVFTNLWVWYNDTEVVSLDKNLNGNHLIFIPNLNGNNQKIKNTVHRPQG